MKPNLPPSQVEEWLASRGGPVTDFQRLTEGLASQAFAFRRSGVDLVLRINRSSAGFRKDPYVSRLFGRPGLPIPEVLEIGTLPGGGAACISRRAPGVRLRDLDAPAAERVADRVACTLDAIAATDIRGTAGFGPFDGSGVAPFPTWAAFLTAVADPTRYDWEAVARRVDAALLAKLRAVVLDLAPRCRCPEVRRLIHGDFGVDNVLSDGRRVTAVIDWALAMFGDPLYEWATLCFWRDVNLRPVLARFEALQPDRQRLWCYQLRFGLEEIRQSAVGGNPVDLDWLVARCSTLLEPA